MFKRSKIEYREGRENWAYIFGLMTDPSRVGVSDELPISDIQGNPKYREKQRKTP